MAGEFSVVIERDEEGYYVASVPALPGCHTQARSLDELMERIREAIALCLEVETQEPSGLEFVGVQPAPGCRHERPSARHVDSLPLLPFLAQSCKAVPCTACISSAGNSTKEGDSA